VLSFFGWQVQLQFFVCFADLIEVNDIDRVLQECRKNWGWKDGLEAKLLWRVGGREMGACLCGVYTGS